MVKMSGREVCIALLSPSCGTVGGFVLKWWGSFRAEKRGGAWARRMEARLG